jgi:transketolase
LLTLIILQVDATAAANSGHPGAPMGMAPVAHVLFNKFMTFNPKNPDWLNRDRFVLSYVFSISIHLSYMIAVHWCTFVQLA